MRGTPRLRRLAPRGCRGLGFIQRAALFRKAEDQERGENEFHGVGGRSVSDSRFRSGDIDAVVEARQAGVPETRIHAATRMDRLYSRRATAGGGAPRSAYLKPRGLGNWSSRQRAATRILIENGRGRSAWSTRRRARDGRAEARWSSRAASMARPTAAAVGGRAWGASQRDGVTVVRDLRRLAPICMTISTRTLPGAREIGEPQDLASRRP